MDISVSKDFAVNSKSLKDVRDFAREIFDKSPVFSEQKDELVLAIAEAAQNIVKHAYKDILNTKDVMQIKISFKNNELTIGFYDKGKPANPENIKHRNSYCNSCSFSFLAIFTCEISSINRVRLIPSLGGRLVKGGACCWNPDWLWSVVIQQPGQLMLKMIRTR